MRNNKGITLIEMLVAIVLLSIMMSALLSLMNGVNFQMRRANIKIKQLNEATTAANLAALKVLKWTDQNVIGTPILCLTNNATYSCQGGLCSYVNNKWKAGGHQCDLGILFY